MFFGLFACSSEQVQPEGIWSKPKMIKVLVEMEKAQATIKFKSATKGVKEDLSTEFNKVYERQQISAEEFNENLAFYCKDPLIMKGIYESVVVKLTAEQVELNESKPKEIEE